MQWCGNDTELMQMKTNQLKKTSYEEQYHLGKSHSSKHQGLR